MRGRIFCNCNDKKLKKMYWLGHAGILAASDFVRDATQRNRALPPELKVADNIYVIGHWLILPANTSYPPYNL